MGACWLTGRKRASDSDSDAAVTLAAVERCQPREAKESRQDKWTLTALTRAAGLVDVANLGRPAARIVGCFYPGKRGTSLKKQL